MNARETGQKLHEYMVFRAACEHHRYELTPDFFRALLDGGVRTFFGIEVDAAGDLLRDTQNPEAFAAFLNLRCTTSSRIP